MPRSLSAAQEAFDAGDYFSAFKQLKRFTVAHPTDQKAIALLGRCVTAIRRDPGVVELTTYGLDAKPDEGMTGVETMDGKVLSAEQATAVARFWAQRVCGEQYVDVRLRSGSGEGAEKDGRLWRWSVLGARYGGVTVVVEVVLDSDGTSYWLYTYNVSI